MDLTFSPAEERFRSEVRDWLHDNKPRERRPPEGYAVREFDLDWQRKQFEGGWAGIAWPVEFGGRGLSLIEQLIWYEEYSAADAPPIGSMFVGVNHAGPTLILKGSREQKKQQLPGILEGRHIWCQGFSEPSSGSDLASIRTHGAIDGSDLVVTGQKIWTTFAYIADYQELLVRTGPKGGKKHDGLSWVICDMRLPGITVRPIKTMAGHLHFAEVFYDEVRIPLSNIVGGLNAGWSVAMATLSFERGPALLGHQKELEKFIEMLDQRSRRTASAAARSDIAARLTDLRADVLAMRSMAYTLVSRAQRHGAPGPETAIVALFFGELSKRAHHLALEIAGASVLENGPDDEALVTSYFDSFRHTIAGGTSEIRRNIIGERVLGLPR